MVRALVLVACLIVAGCHGWAVNADYLHLSSVPMSRDLNTVDQVGVTFEFPVSDHPYATVMEIGMAYELDQEKPVVGDDPVGVIRIRQPIYRSAK